LAAATAIMAAAFAHDVIHPDDLSNTPPDYFFRLITNMLSQPIV
jgi:hypothetical protein